MNQYAHYAASETNFAYLCDSCSLSSLPFFPPLHGDDSSNTESEGNQDDVFLRRADEEMNSREGDDEDGGSQGDATITSTTSAESLANCKGLSFLHLNVQSLLPKLDEIRLLLSKSKAAVLVVTETWLDKSVSDGEVNVDGYNFVRKDRNRHGGGVRIYIRKGINFDVRDINDANLETLFIDVILNKTKPFVVGVCYRPPNDNKFVENFKNVLESFVPDTEIHILGDFNYCFSLNSGIVKTYKTMLNGFSFSQLICNATRVTSTSTSSSIIDHFLTNFKSKISSSGVLDCSFSDHSLIYGIRGSPSKLSLSPVVKAI